METSIPDKNDITEMVQFLPRLYSDDFKAVEKWGGGVQEDGSLVLPWPEYDDEVRAFIQEATKDCWRDSQYGSKKDSARIDDEEFVKEASLEQIRSMLTFCIRGERFCDGHIASKIESGAIKSVLQRLETILSEM